MIRARLLVPLVTAWLASSCSVLIDVPADCDPADCGGFACNADKTECLFQCTDNDDCAGEFVCNTFDGVGQCVEVSCEPLGDWNVRWEQVRDTRNVAAAWNGSALGVVWTTDAGLFFALHDARGEMTGSPVMVQEGTSRPTEPAIAWNGENFAVAWDAVVVVNGNNRESLHFATLTSSGEIVTPVTSLWTNINNPNRQEFSVDATSIDWDADNGYWAIAWSVQIATAADVYLALIRPDGTGKNGETEIEHDTGVNRVTLSGVSSVEPRVLVQNRGGSVAYDVTFREGDDVLLRSLDFDGNMASDDVDVGMAEGMITSNETARLTSGTVVAMTEESDSGSRVYRIQLDPDNAVLGGGRLLVGEGSDEVDDASVESTGEGEYAITYTAAIPGGVRAVFFVRYQDDGRVIGFAVSITDLDSAQDPVQPKAFATSDGYLVLFQETDGPNTGTVRSRFLSCELETP